MKKIFFLLLIAAVVYCTYIVVTRSQFMEVKIGKTAELEYKQFGDKYFIRVYPGQNLVAAVKNLAQQEKITLATISGLGSLKSATLGFFNPDTKEYQQKVIAEPLEMASLVGNITMKDAEPVLHFHTTVAGANYQALAGHMVEATVSLTAELVLKKINGRIEKTFNNQLGLNLFDFSK